jgi:HAD superfamily, subfamily IIIB (Acid phosphatase)
VSTDEGRPPLAVVDIDGVLADVRHRLHHVTGGRRDWDRFFAAAGDDPAHPEGLAVVATLAADHDVVFVTGRPARLRAVTEGWLVDHGLAGHELLMRADDDRRSAARFKLQAIEALRRDRSVDIVVDDDADVLVAVAALGIATYLATWES